MKITDIYARQNYVKMIWTFKSEDADQTSCRRRPSYTAIQRLHLKRVFSVYLGTSGGRSEKIVEMLERSSVDIFYVQEARFKGKFVRRMKGRHHSVILGGKW